MCLLIERIQLSWVIHSQYTHVINIKSWFDVFFFYEFFYLFIDLKKLEKCHGIGNTQTNKSNSMILQNSILFLSRKKL